MTGLRVLLQNGGGKGPLLPVGMLEANRDGI